MVEVLDKAIQAYALFAVWFTYWAIGADLNEPDPDDVKEKEVRRWR